MALSFMIYVFVAPTMAGSLMVAVLTVPNYSTQWLVIAAIAGFVIAAPVSWLVARAIGGNKAKKS